MLENLRKELLNKEMSFVELDNHMMSKGFYSVFEDRVTENIKQDLNVIYTSTETNETEIKIDFEITIDNAEDEAEEAFYLKVNEVEEY